MVSDEKKVQAVLKKYIRFLARTDLFVYTVLWLCVLLVIGTISQKTTGLFQAQDQYFSSWFFWAGGFVPLPAGRLCLTVIFAGLVAKLFTQTWTKAKAGTLIVHIGALLLLLGGFMTAAFSQEGYVAIPEGESRHFMEDYFQVELAVMDAISGEDIAIFENDAFSIGNVLRHDGFSFTIGIDNFYRNISPVVRETPRDDAHGMAKNITLKPVPRAPEEEANNAGIEFYIKGAGQADGFYSLFEQMPIRQTITTDEERRFILDLRPVRTALPFTLQLNDFEKDVYPGTNMARSYRSDIILHDGKLAWHSIISMNEPLRYKGYTFYQSSFLRNEGKEITVLAVVKNAGRLFPYISSIIICIGLLIHLFFRLPQLRGQRDHA